MEARSATKQLANSSHRWSLITYDEEKPLQRCPVQHSVYEPSFVERSLQPGIHARRTVNEFSPLYSYFFCTYNHNQTEIIRPRPVKNIGDHDDDDQWRIQGGGQSGHGPPIRPWHTLWSIDSQLNYQNRCYQMSDFEAKMNQIRFPLGLRPRPRWGSLQRSPRPNSRI